MILAIPTYKYFRGAVECIRSALAGTVKPTRIYVMDNSGNGSFVKYCQENDIHFGTDMVIVIMPPENLGCARAWNDMLKRAHQYSPDEYVLVSNDDITFEPDTLEIFDKATQDRPQTVMFCAGGIAAPNAFSLFCTRYDILLNSVGLFDETFLYPYCEDGDMGRRLWLAGHELDRVDGANVSHVGSATLKEYDGVQLHSHHMRFALNAQYFQLKWGVDHNDIYSEKGFKAPFNGDEQIEELTKRYILDMYRRAA